MSIKDRVSELIWECSINRDRSLYESIKRIDSFFPACFFQRFMNYILARLDDRTFGRVFQTMTASIRRDLPTRHEEFHFGIKNEPFFMNLSVSIGYGGMDFDGDTMAVISSNGKIKQKRCAYSNSQCFDLSFALSDGVKINLSINDLGFDEAQAIVRRAWLYIICNPEDFNDDHWYTHVYPSINLMVKELEFDMEHGETDSIGSYILTVNAVKGKNGLDEFFVFCSDNNKLDISMLALRALEETGTKMEPVAMRL